MSTKERSNLPFISGLAEMNHESGVWENAEWYSGRIPQKEFPDYVRVVYTKCPYTGEQRTKILWNSVGTLKTLDINEGDRKKTP